VGGSLIWQFHHADAPGLELSVVAQVTMFKDPGPGGTYRVQNVVAGGQIAVFPGGQSTFFVALQATTGFTGTYRRGATAQKTWDWAGGLVVGVQW
jgi:hypothetical protein